MNRDQTIIKNIQKTIEIASGKIEKTIKRNTVQAAQKQKRPAACSATFSWARGPTANGRAAESARRGVPSPRPHGPSTSPGGETISWPLITIGRSSVVFARSKPRRRRRGPNPSSFFPPPSLSTLRSGDGHWPWWPGGAGGTAPSRPARRRARSPEGERAAVEPAVDGATLSSPAHATPASRSSEQAAPLCRRAAAQARHTHRRRQWRADQVGPAPFDL